MESKKAKDYLPKNKFDRQSLCGIDELSNEEIQPIIYELLTWLQDYNWPVADKVLQVLHKREILVFPYLADILAGALPNSAGWASHLNIASVAAFSCSLFMVMSLQIVIFMLLGRLRRCRRYRSQGSRRCAIVQIKKLPRSY